MLYSCPRLGSLLPELNVSAFHKTAIGLTAAATLFAGTAAYGQDTAPRIQPTPVVATQTVDGSQCGAFAKYLKDEVLAFKGEFSKTFLGSAGRFLKAGCAAKDADGPIEIITENARDATSFRTARGRMGTFDILAASGVKHYHRPESVGRPVTTGSAARPSAGG